MHIINKLKLAIYESSLDNEDKYNLINIVESTDDEDILCDVVDILEATKEEADEMAKYGKAARVLSSRYEQNGNEKYGSQYEKMSPEEQRRRDIKYSLKEKFNPNTSNEPESEIYTDIKQKLARQENVRRGSKQMSDRFIRGRLEEINNKSARKRTGRDLIDQSNLFDKKIELDEKHKKLEANNESKKRIVDKHKNNPELLEKMNSVIRR